MADLASLFPPFAQNIIFLLLGLVLGSFSTALTHRIPRGLGWGLAEKPRSACPACDASLKFRDLVPVLSWIILRGKCRACRARISPVYPAIELGTLAAVLGVYYVYGFTAQGFAAACAMPFLAALLAIDLKHFILPDSLVAALAVLSVAFHGAAILHFIVPGLAFAFILWLLGWVMEKALKKEALGFGDVKFFGAAGLWLGFSALAPLCLMAGVMGVLMGLVWKIALKSDIFPFGPALIAAFYACLILQGFSVI